MLTDADCRPIQEEHSAMLRMKRQLFSYKCQYRAFLAVAVLAMVQGLAMASTGMFIRFQAGKWMRQRLQDDPVSRLYLDYFNSHMAPSHAPLRLLWENFGNTLLYVGVAVGLISDLGMAGAMYLRTLLVLLSEMAKDSAMKTLEDHAYLTEQLKLDSPWLNGLQLLMVLLDCCGVDGPKDFANTYTDKYVPETCCTGHFMLTAWSSLRPPLCAPDDLITPTQVGDQSVKNCINKKTNNISNNNNNNNNNKDRNSNINKNSNTEFHDDNYNNNNNEGSNNINTAFPTTTATLSHRVNDSQNTIVKNGNSSNYINKEPVPELSACTMSKPDHTHGTEFQKSQGCYDAIFRKIDAALPWLIPIFLIILLTQICMVAGSMYVFNKRMTWADRNPPIPPTTCLPL